MDVSNVGVVAFVLVGGLDVEAKGATGKLPLVPYALLTFEMSTN